MLNLFGAVACSVLVSVLLKLAPRWRIAIDVAIACNYACAMVATALLLRHSWSLFDLSRTGQRIGLACGPLQTQLNTNGCDCARRRRRASRAALSGPRPH